MIVTMVPLFSGKPSRCFGKRLGSTAFFSNGESTTFAGFKSRLARGEFSKTSADDDAALFFAN